MKKIISIALVLVLAISSATSALAFSPAVTTAERSQTTAPSNPIASIPPIPPIPPIKPNEPITKPQIVVSRSYLASYLAKVSGEEIPETVIAFTDTDSNYAQWVFEKGYMLGDGTGKFNPHDALTYEQLAVVLARVLRLEVDGHKRNAISEDLSEWAAPSVAAIDEYIEGKPEAKDLYLIFANSPTASVTKDNFDDIIAVVNLFK